MLRVLDMSSDAARHITGKLSSGPGGEQIPSLRRQAMSNKQEPSRIAVLDDSERRFFARGLVGPSNLSSQFLPVRMEGFSAGEEEDLSMMQIVDSSELGRLSKFKWSM
jgi:hypothetical protein